MKLKEDLLSTVVRGVRAGGESGASVVPKSLDKSLILKAIGYDDSFYEMPPDGKLPNYILKDFEKWIADGAIDPREQKGVANKDAKPDPMKNIEDGRQFWSFVPPKTPPLPQIGKSDWATSPIDFYVQAKRVENGLSRAGPATKQELIRRATYDLTGLPPTPNEVANFLNDDSLDAFETVGGSFARVKTLWGEIRATLVGCGTVPRTPTG